MSNYSNHFTIDDSNHILKCPANCVPVKSEYKEKKKLIIGTFKASDCLFCLRFLRCPTKRIDKNFYYVKLEKKPAPIVKPAIPQNTRTLTPPMNNAPKTITETDKSGKSQNNLTRFKDYTKKDARLGNIISVLLLERFGDKRIVNIPATIEGYEINEIPAGTFQYSKMEQLILPDSVKTIRSTSFADCQNLRKVMIPDSVTHIEEWAFFGCSNLEEIRLSNNIQKIGSHAFDECRSLVSVKLPDYIDYIGAFAFSETAIESITLSHGIKYLANSLFYGCERLQKVELQEGLEEIGSMTFHNCCSMKQLNLPSTIKSIRTAAFGGCINLRRISLPDGIELMAIDAFDNCQNLRRIETNVFDKKVMIFDKQYALHELFEDIEEFKSQPQYITIRKIFEEAIGGPFIIDEYSHDICRNIENTVNRLCAAGVDLKHKGLYEEAKNKYIEALKINPKAPQPYYNLGKILYILRDYEASARAYKVVYELNYDPYNTLVQLGHTLIDPQNEQGKDSDIVLYHRTHLDPHMVFAARNDELLYEKYVSLHPTQSQLEKYKQKCIQAAQHYLAQEN